MEQGGLTRSAFLIVGVGTLAIAMIGFSAWRYEVALTRASAALNDRANATAAAALATAFWHERQAIGGYLPAPRPAAAGAPGAPAAQVAAAAAARGGPGGGCAVTHGGGGGERALLLRLPAGPRRSRHGRRRRA